MDLKQSRRLQLSHESDRESEHESHRDASRPLVLSPRPTAGRKPVGCMHSPGLCTGRAAGGQPQDASCHAGCHGTVAGGAPHF